MKIEVTEDFSLKESFLRIFTPLIDRKIQRIIDFAQKDSLKIQGIKNQQLYFISPNDIVRFYTENKKVYFDTMTDSYLSRERLYQIEEELNSSLFVRISQGELVNINYIQKLDLSFKGSIAIHFKNQATSYVSRRSIKAVKKALQL